MSDDNYPLHKAEMRFGQIVCKDTCPRDDCEEAMADWNNSGFPLGGPDAA